MKICNHILDLLDEDLIKNIFNELLLSAGEVDIGDIVKASEIIDILITKKEKGTISGRVLTGPNKGKMVTGKSFKA